MDLFSKYPLTAGRIAKTAGIAVVSVMVLVLVGSLVGSAVRPGAMRDRMARLGVTQEAAYGGVAGAPAAYPMADYDAVTTSLSVRNVLPPVDGGGSVGDAAEEYEVVSYSARIETGDVARDCAVVAGLKKDADVIFEEASEYDRGCSYAFKVKKSRVADVLAVLNSLDPRDLSENTRTIKRQLDDFTSELDILEKKEDSINATLESALRSYEDITVLATRTQDVESLTRIIESKIQIIERLTQERLRVSEQLDRLSRAKAEQLDRLEYATFGVQVSENALIDTEQLKDSWKASVRDFFRTVNEAVQNATVNLLAVLFAALPYVIYFALALVIAKYAWRFAQRVWKA
jgi:hypothetical protein